MLKAQKMKKSLHENGTLDSYDSNEIPPEKYDKKKKQKICRKKEKKFIWSFFGFY